MSCDDDEEDEEEDVCPIEGVVEGAAFEVSSDVGT
jgi:hypothetical protein